MSRNPQAGDAFERLYAATAPAIRAYIARHCSDRGSIDDLFQRTYLKFLRSSMARRPDDPAAKAYLYRIASNAITDHGRMLQRRRRFEAPMPRSVRQPERRSPVESRALRRALGSLSLREQQLLWLLYGEGFSHKEAARIMGVRPGSVRVLAFRARKKLAQRMDEMERGAKEVSG